MGENLHMRHGVQTRQKKRLTPRVTINDVASELGLAKGTVSRALNGYPDISDGTRQRVKRTADRMGYRPLSHAQAIRTGRVRSIGLVLQINEHDGHRPFLADFLAGLSEAASQENWAMTVATASSEADTLATLARLVDEQKADGFILPRTYLDDPRVTFLRDAGVPFVMFGRTRNPTGCAWFDIASEDAMRDAVLRLAGLGHERIAFIGSDARYTYSGLRVQGYRDGLARAGLPFDPALMRGPAMNRREGAAAATALLALDRPPTAFVVAMDQAAFGLYDAADAAGLSIGQELSVISYDGLPETELMRPPLSTFSVDNRHGGHELARLLIARIRGDAPEDLRRLSPATFEGRGSHGPCILSSEALSERLGHT